VTHHWWFGVYVAVALASFLTSIPGMTRTIRQWWDVKCSCCDEKVALWHRFAMVVTCLVVYPLRAMFWPLAMPIEVVVLVREGLREREKQ